MKRKKSERKRKKEREENVLERLKEQGCNRRENRKSDQEREEWGGDVTKRQYLTQYLIIEKPLDVHFV